VADIVSTLRSQTMKNAPAAAPPMSNVQEPRVFAETAGRVAIRAKNANA
jgi:hypothetical protein